MNNLKTLCLDACSVVENSATFIMNEWKNFTQKDVEEKGSHDFVTYVDKQSERILVDGLSKLFPQSVFLTEEKTINTIEGEYTWIIDPLDGTTNYIHHLSPVAISIALYKKHEPLIGIVYEISHRECFYTWKNGPALLNNKEIHVSNTQTVKDSLIATGFPYYDYSKIEGMLRSLEGFFKYSHGVRRLGSAATDLVYVACGRFEAFYEYGLHPWDVAAGAFIVQQAGGKVSDFSGTNNFLFGKEIVATNSLVYDEFLANIQKFFFS